MADADMSRHFRHRVPEHLIDQTHAAADVHRIAVGHANSRAFLTPMLQSIETPVSIQGNIDTWSVDSEDPTFFVQFVETQLFIQ